MLSILPGGQFVAVLIFLNLWRPVAPSGHYNYSLCHQEAVRPLRSSICYQGKEYLYEKPFGAPEH